MAKRRLSPPPIQKYRYRRTRFSSRTELTLGSLCLFLVILIALKIRTHPVFQRENHEPGQPTKKIAIHLGASESRVGISENNQIKILGSIPSYVTVANGSLIAGHEARDTGGLNFFNVALNMGMRSDFARVESDENVNPFEELEDDYIYNIDSHSESPPVNMTADGAAYSFTPAQIYAPLLSNLRSIAQSYLGTDVNINGAVISFPLSQQHENKRHETTRGDIMRASEMINLPIIDIERESHAAGIALGIDALSDWNNTHYVLFYDLNPDFDSLTVLILDGAFNTLAVTRGYNISTAPFLERNDPRYKDQDSPILDHLEGFFVVQRPVIKDADFSDLKLAPGCPSCAIQQYSVNAIHNALSKAKLRPDQITDVVFMPSSRAFPKLQRRMASWFKAPNLRIANAENLDEVAIHGATRILENIEDSEFYQGVTFLTRERPSFGIFTPESPDSVLEVIPEAQRVPSFGKQTFTVPCQDRDANATTSIKVYKRDGPILYIRPEFNVYDAIAVGELDVSAWSFCRRTWLLRPADVELEVWMLFTRDLDLRVQVTNLETGESGIATMSNGDVFCAHSGRCAPGNYTLLPGGDLEGEYAVDLRRVITFSGDQKATDAFDAGLFGDWDR
ncbi:hypothetical protein BDW74DRAFT_104476 [Aspergillus multicolor]|uniref:uncharacterized protein n=1 Tax=Aspergillus multicolor TaxID=41759 RepID=UPI003CCDAF89